MAWLDNRSGQVNLSWDEVELPQFADMLGVDLKDLGMEVPTDDDVFEEKFKSLDNEQAVYPIIPKYDERHELFVIVSDNEVWVVVNYRETQMKHVAVGNKVSIMADAIPDVVYQGEVEAISGGTGSAFSQIPVDNATGNFVKVEQRVPVRIRLKGDNKKENVARLLAGLNVETEVKY